MRTNHNLHTPNHLDHLLEKFDKGFDPSARWIALELRFQDWGGRSESAFSNAINMYLDVGLNALSEKIFGRPYTKGALDLGIISTKPHKMEGKKVANLILKIPAKSTNITSFEIGELFISQSLFAEEKFDVHVYYAKGSEFGWACAALTRAGIFPCELDEVNINLC